MGYASIYAITFVAVVGALLLVSKAQPSGSCVSTLTTLSPCLSYITGNSTTPSQTCCSQLDSVIKSSPQCICSAVNSPIPNIGLNINRTQALQLPNACTIQAPPLSQCNGSLSNKPLYIYIKIYIYIYIVSLTKVFLWFSGHWADNASSSSLTGGVTGGQEP